MFFFVTGKNKTVFWANVFFCVRIWNRLRMRMRKPVQDGFYCESFWNCAKLEQTKTQKTERRRVKKIRKQR